MKNATEKISAKNTYYERNKEWIKEYAGSCNHQEDNTEEAKQYFQNEKEELQSMGQDRYRNRLEEEKK